MSTVSVCLSIFFLGAVSPPAVGWPWLDIRCSPNCFIVRPSQLDRGEKI